MSCVKKKKALIIYSQGGGGHLSAANSVSCVLSQNNYKFDLINITDGIILNDKIYDFLFNREWWNLLKLLISLRHIVEYLTIKIKGREILQKLNRKIGEEKVDLVISVFPIGNALYQEFCLKENLPFIIIPTDFKNDHFFSKLNSERGKSNTTAIFPFKNQSLYNKLKKKNISIVNMDYPIREEFEKVGAEFRKGPQEENIFTSALENLKKSYEIKMGDKIILLSIGAKGYGVNSYINYIDTINDKYYEIKNADETIHLLAATGKSNTLKYKLEEYYRNKKLSIRLHILGPLEAAQMALHMKLSHVIISKPGGGIVAESMALGLPMLLKSESAKSLFWERGNMAMVKKNNWGISLDHGKGFSSSELIEKLNYIFSPMFQQKVYNVPPVNQFSNKFGNFLKKIN